MDNYQDSLDEKTIKMVLQEYGEQQQELTDSIRQQQNSMDTLVHRQTGLEQKWADLHLKLAAERNTYRAALKAGLAEIHASIRQQPKAVVRQFRILLFPEYNATEYYRIVFGRVLGWLVLLVAATYLFSLGKLYIERSQSVREKEMEAAHYRKAWEYLYQHEKKEVQKRMETVWERNRHQP